jgi:hypothetical protein
MGKSTRRRYPKYALHEKVSLKRNLHRYFLRSLPSILNAINVLMIAAITVSLVLIGWVALTRISKRKVIRTDNNHNAPVVSDYDDRYNDPLQALARVEYLNQMNQKTRYGPQAIPQRQAQEIPPSPSQQAVASYPVPDPRGGMATRYMYADGHQETTRRDQPPFGLPVGAPSQPGGPRNGVW